ncbi:hypothetical protein ACJIZ3_002372 [Penstemon smallii]|uniref:Extradiol ring-cleavage dioxygenase class III enzyme subunit B domain-containing protein n=1 Tax=Penstemon smallii TaxID=265156 RepID=A0ABD3U693_9LAMI
MYQSSLIFSKLKYPAPGAPELVNKVKKLLGEAGFKRISLFANSRSKQIWMQLIITTWDRIWPPLKEEGVLIVCSGNDTHNLSSMQRDNDIVASWALEFDNWLKDSLLNGRCVKYEGKAPFAKQAHLELEHLYPLDVVIDAAGINAKTDLIHHNWTSYTISYASYKFTEST